MKARSERLRPVPERRVRRGFYILPNLLTTGGLLAGVYSLVACLRGDFFLAAVAIMAANIFDVLDGRVARVTKTTSEFGSQYDSLADLVAFGVAPAILLYRFALEAWGSLGWLAAALYVICGALRLARFNVQRDDVAKRHFVGLPIPAAAEVIASTVLLYVYLLRHRADLAADVTRRFGWLLTVYVLADPDGQQLSILQLQGDPLSPPAVLGAARGHRTADGLYRRAADIPVRGGRPLRRLGPDSLLAQSRRRSRLDS